MKPEKIPNAVIVHGPGRSGTTLVSNILSLHPDFSWISGWVNRVPGFPGLAICNRAMRIGAVERFSRGRRCWPRPAEAYGFWRHFFPDFSKDPIDYEPMRDPAAVKRCIASIWVVCRAAGGSRFITKLTGYSRAVFLREVFDNPTILWVDRDPRAVIASYFKQRWGYKDRLEGFHSKSAEELLSEYATRFERYQLSRADLGEFECLVMRYEELVTDPLTVLTELQLRLGLPPSRRWLALVRSWGIETDRNDAWRSTLGTEDSATLERLLANRESAVAGIGSRDEVEEGDP